MNIGKFEEGIGVVDKCLVTNWFYREFWSAHHRLHGPWIVKPVASSRGRGIYLVSKVSCLVNEHHNF